MDHSSALPSATLPAAAILPGGQHCLVHLEKGSQIKTTMLRAAMEDACGGTDSNGEWVWKDAYDALEFAAVLFLLKYDRRIRKQTPDRNVAEITGRSRRAAIQRRPASDKRVIVFFDAGGTGRSYHADRTVKNQRLRVHCLLEAGWRADNGVQGLGRSHRTNQAQPPLFRPVASNVKGEKRFLSTIARRLDTIGTITKGQRQTGGQGIFRADDNLENDYARAALRKFFQQLHRGNVDDCSLDDFCAMTGLTLTDKDGSLKNELPPIAQFLNRRLALRIDVQNRLFDVYMSLLEDTIEDAKRAGTYNLGLETLVAERFDIIDRKVVYIHHKTGAQSYALAVDETTRNNPVSLDRAREIVGSYTSCVTLYHPERDQAALAHDTRSYTDEHGKVHRCVRLIRPLSQERIQTKQFNDQAWQIVDHDQFAEAWSRERAKIPDFSTRRFTLVCGLRVLESVLSNHNIKPQEAA